MYLPYNSQRSTGLVIFFKKINSILINIIHTDICLYVWFQSYWIHCGSKVTRSTILREIGYVPFKDPSTSYFMQKKKEI